jgi:hypothetical protein
MIESTRSNIKTKVNPGDWKDNSSDLQYKGKYQVGRFTLSDDFMIQYMNIIHGVPMDIDSVQANEPNENIVMYMQHYDVIDKSTLLEMREMVKQPKHGFSVYQEKNVITGIYRDTNHD